MTHFFAAWSAAELFIYCAKFQVRYAYFAEKPEFEYLTRKIAQYHG